MTTIDYVLIGHVTADLVANGRILGGTVSYSAPIARAFGHRVGLLTSIAYNEPLVEPLLPYAELVTRLAPHTTTFENIYNDGRRTQYLHHRAAELTADFVPLGWRDASLLHLAPLDHEVDTGIIEHFPNATILLTPQGFLRKWGEDKRVHFLRWLDADFLRAVDIVVLSRQDIQEAPELAEEYAQVVKHLLVTNGEHGGTYYHNGQATEYAPYDVNEVDPTGAGDVFAAALLSSLSFLNHDIKAALSVAARLAALAVTRRGPSPDFSTDEVHAALQAAREGMAGD